jgi:hypothetical protein
MSNNIQNVEVKSVINVTEISIAENITILSSIFLEKVYKQYFFILFSTTSYVMACLDCQLCMYRRMIC